MMWAKEDGDSTLNDENIKRFFAGQMYDKESGLYYMNARYYDPDIGTFMTADPAMSGLNHYAYASCNPIKYTDPTGMEVDTANYGSEDIASGDFCYSDNGQSPSTTSTSVSSGDDVEYNGTKISKEEFDEIEKAAKSYYASEEYAIALYNLWNPLNGKDGWSFSGWASAREGNPQSIVIGKDDMGDDDVIIPINPNTSRNITEKEIELLRAAYIDITKNNNKQNLLQLEITISGRKAANQAVTVDFYKGQNFYYSRNFSFLVALAAKQEYFNKHQKELNISIHSLAIEINVHAVLFENNYQTVHTHDANCGEKDSDRTRWNNWSNWPGPDYFYRR